MNISLPRPLKRWVERHVARQGYGTPDVFFRQILQRERALEARERIDDLLTEAISHGEPTPMTKKDWDRVRVAGRKLALQRRKK